MKDLLTSETKLFSTRKDDKLWNKILVEGSRNHTDAQLRKNVYGKMFSRYEENKELFKMYSGYAEMPLLSNQYFNATISSYVRSIAGYFTIERDMDAPQALLWFHDTLGVTNNRVVMPNVGQENLNGINAKFSTTSVMDTGETFYTVSTNKKLIPGSIKLKLVHALSPNTEIVITDDREGNLLAPAGILAPNSDLSVGVNYATGLIGFTVGDGFTIASGDSYSIVGFEDVAGAPDYGTLAAAGNNRFKLDMKNIPVVSEPDMLVAESNLMTMAAMMKAVGSNPIDVAGAKLVELYTKLINGKIADQVRSAFVGNAYTVDVASAITKFLDYQSRLDYFQSELVNIDTELAKQSVKGVEASAYLVGTDTGNWFRKLSATGNFVDNAGASYINDLLGYYKGKPVVRHNSIGAKDGYAVHKTPDGQLAPVIRGIFLPLTNTPTVGNYNNPAQTAQGIYYQEANEAIVPELVMKFSVNA